ncbi:MAG: DUF2231 domain-containing protein [Candidatus Marinimicrobia bacterium]|jgi:uncharacterized membrane protein|nr:DUF2231 domain-containing protein [Candidatus Neomarinimicrobiota bacterium]MBT3575196.1 DUF2231 domain-containing protein [Candidatus Neomarinimicrobiota bacterium]MBT3680872.1 DUF2231 domain-containing protein [Candidatus Neomarinimicrobiota bacterium]MBT3951410.1 DUF2231 domain-containing protein [Candidatus Neomarinimicrobiota bacterium]MBT4252842.1 DUF2231 domain-containing protein [Candidatus Neomarinimicrobiota bacterium]
MAELHPFFVHFPIAILVVAAGFEVYGASRSQEQHTQTAFLLQLMAGVFAIFAAISGNMAETLVANQKTLHQGVIEAFDKHASMGNAMVWLIILLAVGRTFAVLEKKDWAMHWWIFPILSTVVALLVIITGLLGGDLSASILTFYIDH